MVLYWHWLFFTILLSTSLALSSQQLTMASSWPTKPFRFIGAIGIHEHAEIPKDHFCIRNAQIMAQTHNTMFSAFNAIYSQAPLVKPSTQQAADLLFYTLVACQFLEVHHTVEDEVYFPAIEAASDIKGLMKENFEQHKQLASGLENLTKYSTETSPAAYDPTTLRQLLEDLAGPLQTHLDDEIPTILNLHSHVKSEDLKVAYKKMHKASRQSSDAFKTGPFIFGNQDNHFELDGEIVPYPAVPHFVHYIMDWFIARRYRSAWQFNPSDLYGNPKPFPPVIGQTPIEASTGSQADAGPKGSGIWQAITSWTGIAAFTTFVIAAVMGSKTKLSGTHTE